ncbi:hypothetical protein ABT168_12780 [Streptomyces sp. NPDC001793]|uniref:hypothetical protein n=1 Tax=Streptomyces sp. NPDC001793 TaxID=3154657 RepID=UPI00332648B6
MDPLMASLLTALVAVTIVAVAAVLITHLAVRGTESRHRAAVLESVASVIRSIHSKR